MREGCETCIHKDENKTDYPCYNCSMQYPRNWEDNIEVGSIVNNPYHDDKMIVIRITRDDDTKYAHTLTAQCLPDVYNVRALIPTGKVMPEMTAIIKELEDNYE